MIFVFYKLKDEYNEDNYFKYKIVSDEDIGEDGKFAIGFDGNIFGISNSSGDIRKYSEIGYLDIPSDDGIVGIYILNKFKKAYPEWFV